MLLFDHNLFRLMAIPALVGAFPSYALGAAADDEPTPAEQAEIERALASDADVPAQSVASPIAPFLPDIAVNLMVAAAVFSDDDHLQLGGHDPTNTGFNLQAFELSLSKNVDPYFRLDSTLVFSLSEVELEEAYVTTLALPGSFQLRAGQFLSRFGRINPTHAHAWDFVDQPMMWSKVFGGEGDRGLGAELSVLLPLPWYVELVGSSMNATGIETSRSFLADSSGGVHSPLDLKNMAALKQFFEISDGWSLLWGLSAVDGPNANGDDTRTNIYGSDVYIKYRPIDKAVPPTISLQTEWLYRRRQILGGLLQDTGGYASLLYRFAPRWGMAGRYEVGSATVDADAVVVPEPLDVEQAASRQKGAINLTFWPTEFSRLGLQGSADFPRWRPLPIRAAFLSLHVVAGAHGAHAY